MVRSRTRTSGSSPLSRGIPAQEAQPARPARIIPALAGNTALLGGEVPQIPDHPRSRGEYLDSYTVTREECGSSPLSRGIRELLCQPVETDRIIPALAGNTSILGGELIGSTDHPRSRGEYGSSVIPIPPWEGSSPLSRGIRMYGHLGSKPDRIIPALAGNTTSCSMRSSCGRDHPRSRGEY